MFKILVLGVILWHEVVKDVYGQPVAGATDTQPPALSLTNNGSGKGLTLGTDGKYFQASQQFFYLQGLFGRKNPMDFASNLPDANKELDADYVVSNGVGAHKVHIRKLTWNKARHICVEEGGHLLTIRTDSEEKIVLRLMLESAIEEAWVGYHDKFEEGDWISVLDESLPQMGWSRWSKSFTPNPDNYGGNQHCARLIRKGGGLDDIGCDLTKPFICKIPLA